MSLASLTLNYDGITLTPVLEYDDNDKSEDSNVMLFIFYRRLNELMSKQPLRGDLATKATLVLQYQSGDKPRVVVTHRHVDGGNQERQTVPDTMAALLFQYMTDPDTPDYDHQSDFLRHRFPGAYSADAANPMEANP